MRQRALLVILMFQICATNACSNSPSSCGKIADIHYPFRLKGDPETCDHERYELTCENNITLLKLYSGKYHVQAINYNNFTVRVVDPGVQQPDCASLPRYFLSRSNFSDTYNRRVVDPYLAGMDPSSNWDELLFQHILFLNCAHPVTDNHKYVDTAPCFNKGYIYAIAGDLKAEDFEIGCHVKLVALSSWWGLDTNKSSSYTVMQKALAYGFEISWMRLACKNKCEFPNDDCYFDSSRQELHCCHILMRFLGFRCGTGIWYRLQLATTDNVPFDVLCGLGSTFFFGLLLIIGIFIWKWRKRHFSLYQSIENYLQQNDWIPIQYSYKEVKKMTKGFNAKLGEGGFGSVFKGKLRSGSYVAIKMLGKSKGNGQDFISEVATIGRIRHMNIVQLIGFCFEGSKRALVYEFMPNGSLDKFIFSKDENMHLSYDQIYNISIGVARGIAYLHHECEMRILHFDIKPHNILLDDKFIPKVSDFGLAKLYPIDNSIVTMTAARGTIGYMAPELFYKNIGGVSHKADVYSFGMLLMEMASKRKNLNPHVEHSSQLYFPLWIYDQLRKEKYIEVEDVTEEEKKMVKKMIIVALWCIQLKPDDRPSMNKVAEMLEEDIENIEIPPKPSLYPHETMEEDKRIISNQIGSSDSISSSSHSTTITSIPP